MTARTSLTLSFRRKTKLNKRTRRHLRACRDRAIMYADTRFFEREHHSLIRILFAHACTAQVLYGEFQNITQETQQTRSSTFRKAHRFCHIADDVQRETREQAPSKHARRCQVARDVERHRPQEDGRRYGKFSSITSFFFAVP